VSDLCTHVWVMCAHQRKWFARSDTVINTITVAVTVAMADTATVVVTIAIEPATTSATLRGCYIAAYTHMATATVSI